MNRKLLFTFLFGVILIGLAVFFGQSLWSSEIVWQISNGGKSLLPLLLITALVDSINPCAFSILLLTIAFLFSLKSDRQKIITIGGTYIAGLFFTYVLIGLGILQTLHLFNTPHFMGKVGAVLLLVVGAINAINALWPQFPLKLKIPQAVHGRIAGLIGKVSLPAAFGLGLLVGLCEFPCTGGPYMTALGLLHDQATYWQGLFFLVLYNIVFVLPLVVILSLSSDEAVLGRIQTWRKENNKLMVWTGTILSLGLGLLILLM